VNKWIDGHVYTGTWRESKRCGEGAMVYPDGSRYEGTWRDDMPSGRGRFTGKDGKAYEMIDGKRI